jgi:hypothetical protein
MFRLNVLFITVLVVHINTKYPSIFVFCKINEHFPQHIHTCSHSVYVVELYVTNRELSNGFRAMKTSSLFYNTSVEYRVSPQVQLVEKIC